jgi:hypothetical protein
MQPVPTPEDSPLSLHGISICTALYTAIACGRNSLPEERPAILVDIRHLRGSGCGAGVRLAGSVGSSVGGVILVIGDEDGKGLRLCFGIRGCVRVAVGIGRE